MRLQCKGDSISMGGYDDFCVGLYKRPATGMYRQYIRPLLLFVIQ